MRGVEAIATIPFKVPLNKGDLGGSGFGNDQPIANINKAIYDKHKPQRARKT
jgi:hypothetical protein